MQRTEREFHIQCKMGDVGKYCILPGDPGRCEEIAQYLEYPRLVACNREFVTYTGLLEDEEVSVVSTGIGGPSAAIAMEELIHLGVTHFLRIGTCGGINLRVQAGDLVIPMSAIRQEGTSYEYAPSTYPATADYSLLHALVQAAEELKLPHHVGVVQSKDSFYGQHSPLSMPVSPTLLSHWNAYKQLGVLASEMESAALFTVSAARNVRCAAIFTALWNQEREAAHLDQNTHFDTDSSIRCSILALKNLIRKAR